MIIHMILYKCKNVLLQKFAIRHFFKNLRICSAKFGNIKSVWAHVTDWMRYLDYGVRKTTNDAIKFSYHFSLSDAQPDFSGTFHQDFSHIAQARWK